MKTSNYQFRSYKYICIRQRTYVFGKHTRAATHSIHKHNAAPPTETSSFIYTPYVYITKYICTYKLATGKK